MKARPLRHEVATVQELGWAGVKNGRLLDLAEAESFEVLVTTDQSLRHQQDLSKRRLGFVVLPSNQVPVIVKLLARIEDALSHIAPGSVIELPLPGD